MWVMILFAVFLTGAKSEPIVAITRPQIGYYPSEQSCLADREKQVSAFLSGMTEEPYDIAGKCVKITGPEGKEAKNELKPKKLE
jgi:hypothetical protein